MIEHIPSFLYSDLLYPTDDTVRHLRHVCATYGFFTITSHPLPQVLLENARAAAIRFFQLPCEVKDRYGHECQIVSPKSCRGYSRHEVLNKDDGDGGKECFDLGVEKPNVMSDLPFTGPTVFPTEEVASMFSSSLLEMQQVVMGSLVPVLGRAFALALGKDSAFFADYLRNPTLIQRVNYYRRETIAGRHTDTALFTVLFQDETEDGEQGSLKVYTCGKWIDVPGKSCEVVINLGDLLQLWSNGEFVSTPHMVRYNGCKERISFPFFIYPDIRSSFTPFGTEEKQNKKIHVKDIISRNFANIWELGTGAGRALELKKQE